MNNYVLNFSDLDINKTYTYADYLLWKFDEQVELIKGKIFKMSPAPNSIHMRLNLNLIRNLSTFFNGHSCQLFTAPYDIVLNNSKSKKNPKSVVQPDLGVICDLTKLDINRCNGAPDLVIEILSPGNSKKEMKIKYELYEENEVKEYWIVDPDHETISIFILENTKFKPLKPFTTDEIFSSSLYPNLKINVEEIFKNVNTFN